MNLNHITLPAENIVESVIFYLGMGFSQITSSPHYSRFECPDGASTFSVHFTNKLAAETGVIVYFECADLDDAVLRLISKGYVFHQLPTDQHWLWREARLKDPSNNEICLFWAGANRVNPPWRIKSRSYI